MSWLFFFFCYKNKPGFQNSWYMTLRIPDQTDSHFITFKFVYYDRSTDLEFEVKKFKFKTILIRKYNYFWKLCNLKRP